MQLNECRWPAKGARNNLEIRIAGSSILGDQSVSRSGRKGATKVFNHGRKSPWVPTLTGPFPNGQANTGSWLSTKNAVSFEFIPWVRTRRLLSRHSCPVRSPSFPNQKRRDYRWVEKRSGCYQQEQFSLHWENSVSDGSQCVVNNWKFKMQRRQEVKKKSNSYWQGKTTTLRVHHSFFVHFFAVTARLPRENA